MVSLMMKKVGAIACAIGAIVLMGSLSLHADNTKSSKQKRNGVQVRGNKDACDKALVKSIACVEKSICDELRKFHCVLFELFGEQNEFFCNKTELLNLRLKDGIAFKDKASTMLLKDFIVHRLQNTEHKLEEFINHEFADLKSFICHKFKDIDCEIQNILCESKDIRGEIVCIIGMLSAYLEAVFNADLDNNPFFLAEGLSSIIEQLEACIPTNPCDTNVP